MSGRTVVGVGAGPAAASVLVRGVEEACRRGGELVVVRAFSLLGEPPSVYLTEPATIRILRHRAAAVIERALSGIGGAPYDLELRRETPMEAPGHALVTYADRPDDLLIVGRDRHRALHRLLHGSVTGYCVAHASCRVLVVPGAAAPVNRTDRHIVSRTAIHRRVSTTEST